MRRQSFANAALNIAVGAFALAATAADKSYTPSGTPPYLWSDATAWGGSEPGTADVVTIADAGLLVHPLVLEAAISATVSSCNLDNAILYVENGGSLDVSGNILLASILNGVCVITNFGTITVDGNFDMGVYGGNAKTQKGRAAQVDNYGTINIGTRFRMSGTGTPSVFHNHEGATFNKTGGGSWTFYTACAAASTIINEGTWLNASGNETWTGNSSARTDLINRGTATFNPGNVFKIGHGASSVTAINMYDSSKMLGNATFNVAAANKSKGYIVLSNATTFAAKAVNLGMQTGALGVMQLSNTSSAELSGSSLVGGYLTARGELHMEDSATMLMHGLYVAGPQHGCATGLVTLAGSSIISNTYGALVIGCYSNACGRMTLTDNSRLISDVNVYIGHGDDKSSEGATGCLTLSDNTLAEFTGNYLYMGGRKGTTGTLELRDSSALGVSNLFNIGTSTYATGIVTVANSARIDAGEINVAAAWLSRGLMTVTNDATVTCTNMTICASNTSDGDLLIHGGTVVSSNLTIAAFGTSDGCAVVADGGRLVCSNITMATADRAEAYMTVTNGGFAMCPDIQLGTGKSGYAHLKVADDAVLVASNLTLAVNTTASTGILEIAEGAVVSNTYIKIGCNSDSSRGILKMSGGSLIIDGKSPHDPIYLNQRLSSVSAWIRGWGKVAYENPRAMITEWPTSTRTRCIVHYGQVIADGEGVERDLDFSRFAAMSYRNTEANRSGTNGWFAVNKGRLKLPRCLPRKTASYRCVGDCYDLNYANEANDVNMSNRLSNTFSCVFKGAELDNFIFSELYATDRSDIPAGLPSVAGSGSVMSVWRIGLFTDGPEVDDPVNPDAFTSAKLHFRLPKDIPEELVQLCVYRHDGTPGGSWRLVGRTAARRGWPVVPANVSAPSSANWNLGWFAVVGREKPFGTTLTFR